MPVIVFSSLYADTLLPAAQTQGGGVGGGGGAGEILIYLLVKGVLIPREWRCQHMKDKTRSTSL